MISFCSNCGSPSISLRVQFQTVNDARELLKGNHERMNTVKFDSILMDILNLNERQNAGFNVGIEQKSLFSIEFNR